MDKEPTSEKVEPKIVEGPSEPSEDPGIVAKAAPRGTAAKERTPRRSKPWYEQELVIALAIAVPMFGFFVWLIGSIETERHARISLLEPFLEHKLQLQTDTLASDDPDAFNGNPNKKDEQGRTIQPTYRLLSLRGGTIIVPHDIPSLGQAVRVQIVDTQSTAQLVEARLIYIPYRAVLAAKQVD